MGLSNGDKAICAKIAGEVIEKAMKEHLKTCPVKVDLKIKTAHFVGIIFGCVLGSGVGSGSVVYAIIKVLGN